MKPKEYLPNIITLVNLFSGTIACIFAVKSDFEMTALWVCVGILFDFFDGFVARLLNIESQLGKQLDSLSDMVTSGVVPGIMMVKLLADSLDQGSIGYFGTDPKILTEYLPYIGLLLTLSAGYRLAKFNIDKRQSDSFIGLPTPAMSLFIISLPLIYEFSDKIFFVNLILNPYFLISSTILLSVLMNAEIHLFSFKFKNFKFKDNIVRYLFLTTSLLLLIVFHFVAVPLIVLWYVLLSIIVRCQNI